VSEEEELAVLVERARGGDREAADEIARRYEGRVRRAIQLRLAPDLKARVDTDDIFQSTFSAALGSLEGIRYEGEKAFVAWLTKAAEHRVIQAARRHRAQKRDVGRQRPLLAARDRSAALTSPTQGAIRNETRGGIRQAISRLQGDRRYVVELRAYEGLSFRAIAERVGLQDKNAARYLYRSALREMGDLLDAVEEV